MMTALVNRLHSGQTQLTRSLERILEEAFISGELKLSNRKLRDFPKSATNYDLSDTVKADLSRNKFCEIPEDVTSFVFLETLILYHNVIRVIPTSIKELTSLTFLDLRSNQLTTLPREICFLPLQVLLVSNNRLVALPDELGRMTRLKDLDASCNQLTCLPGRCGDLKSLRSLSLRSNQLMILPREITTLHLVVLNLSGNKITSLPNEIRIMDTLVELNVENNPLTSPPASLCVRGLVHIIKYLENQSSKDDQFNLNVAGREQKGNLVDPAKGIFLNLEVKHNDGDVFDGSWTRDLYENGYSKSGHLQNQENHRIQKGPRIIPTNHYDNGIIKEDSDFSKLQRKNFEKKRAEYLVSNSSCGKNNGEENLIIDNKRSNKPKDLKNIQTYREYKEALKQQRNQEISGLYKAKKPNTDVCGQQQKENVQNSQRDDMNNTSEKTWSKGNIDKNSPSNMASIKNNITAQSVQQAKEKLRLVNSEYNYVKPDSPAKTSDSFIENVSSNKAIKTEPFKLKPISRSRDPNKVDNTEKLSFTMRREFDKHKEEIELTLKLRTIIETRLKMSLPEDLASALNDGVILCHLANYISPHSVGSIHVPSPGVPKLTMARRRRNVDNFLDACRKIGIDENLICCASDVLEGKGVVQIAITVSELFRILDEQSSKDNSPNRKMFTADYLSLQSSGDQL